MSSSSPPTRADPHQRMSFPVGSPPSLCSSDVSRPTDDASVVEKCPPRQQSREKMMTDFVEGLVEGREDVDDARWLGEWMGGEDGG